MPGYEGYIDPLIVEPVCSAISSRVYREDTLIFMSKIMNEIAKKTEPQKKKMKNGTISVIVSASILTKKP